MVPPLAARAASGRPPFSPGVPPFVPGANSSPGSENGTEGKGSGADRRRKNPQRRYTFALAAEGEKAGTTAEGFPPRPAPRAFAGEGRFRVGRRSTHHGLTPGSA